MCISTLLFPLLITPLYPSFVDARCPNGTHKSPSGDCEKVIHSGGCPNGYHRSPDGDCERVSSSDGSSGTRNSNDEEDGDEDKERSENTDNDANEDQEGNDTDKSSFFNSETPSLQFIECKGSGPSANKIRAPEWPREPPSIDDCFCIYRLVKPGMSGSPVISFGVTNSEPRLAGICISTIGARRGAAQPSRYIEEIIAGGVSAGKYLDNPT